MKNLFSYSLLVFSVFLCQILIAQTVPQGMNYQAVARDLNGNPLSSKSISLQINILEGSADGKVVYSEVHSVVTDDRGLFVLTVGKGKALNGGLFSKIPWSTNEMWIQLSIDEKGGSNFQLLTASQLWAIPYAFHAGSAETILLPETEKGIGCGSTGLPFWSNLGNSNVLEGCHFIGTTVAVALVFKTDNVERMRIDPDGKVTILHDTRMEEDLTVGGTLTIEGGLNIADNLIVTSDLVTVKRQFVVEEDAVIEGNLQVIGHGSMKTLTILGNDRAHLLNTTDDGQIPAFTVVVFDEKQPGKIRPCNTAYDRKVAGVVSNTALEGKHRPGIVHAQENTANGSPVAIDGTVEVMAIGPVAVGDLLTTSTVSGHAMKVKNRRKSQGAVIGKAITPLASGEKGRVEIWVERH